MMPKIASGDANKVWIVPSEFSKALEGLGSTMSSMRGIPDSVDGPRTRVDMGSTTPVEREDTTLASTHDEVAAAIAAAEASSETGHRSQLASAIASSTSEPAHNGTANGTSEVTGAPPATSDVPTSDMPPSTAGDPGEPSPQ
jgi:hypothetical protein